MDLPLPHDRALVAGLGCSSAATVDELRTLLDDCLAAAGAGVLTALVTIDSRTTHPALVALAAERGIRVTGVDADTLAAQRTPHTSERARRETGTGSVAEAAALTAGATLLVERTASAHATCAVGELSPDPYLAGLRLAGRRVLVVGAGKVATRRIPRLLQAGARVHVVAPQASEQVRNWAHAGTLEWSARPATSDDLHNAWYAVVASDDPQTNQAIAQAAEQQRIFCVRSDAAHQGTAWTVSADRLGSHQVAVLGRRDPRGTPALLRAIVETMTRRGGDRP